MQFVKILGVVITLFTPFAAVAQDRFDEAVTAWLNVDDAKAYPLLAELADQGDERAMLLLGAIELFGPQSAWLDGLDRKGRMAIMRVPGGLSGKSRLSTVSEHAALAAALRAAPGSNDFADRAIILLQLGETAAGRRVALTAFNQNLVDLVRINAAAPLPDDLRAFLWFAAGYRSDSSLQPDNSLRARTDEEARLLAEAMSPAWADSYQQHLFLSDGGDRILGLTLSPEEGLINRALRLGEVGLATRDEAIDPAMRTVAFDRAAEILMQAVEAAPLRAICAKACPDAPSDCVRTLYSEIHGSFGLLAIRSPLSTVVPEDRYFASPRYLDDLRRSVLPAGVKRPAVAAYGQCAMALLHP